MAKVVCNGFKVSSGSCEKNGFGGCGKNLDHLAPVVLKMQSLSKFGSVKSEVFGRRVGFTRQERSHLGGGGGGASDAMMSISIGKSLKWWEKGLQPNMKEIEGAEDLVESLSSAGDKLVVVDFFSPGCGGCKALHPKICQLAEMNPDVQFLQVNYEDHKSMCYSLNVHVLPFFRFYRGAEGRLCSFSCTNATIKKFKDALAKHSPDRCSLGPPKGLEEKELVALGANRDLSFVYTPRPEHQPKEIAPPALPQTPVPVSGPLSEPSLPLPLPIPLKSTSNMKEDSKDKNLVSSGR
ncbi:thioredoxin-like 1-1 protein [Artemisia annua]|uniref:Thioredoxin-like 1-1 protein n=1 Tax=Artemisia annua TaxID=35608 RepID=A0A2U1LTL4_ARTAN|nr:thioredoxin-like 1-1 protein [Artemisia annua]